MKSIGFLPATKEEMERLGWDEVDFVLVTGDPYIDHPSFGCAIISRLLENNGFKVAILSQPNWKDVEEFKRFGRPRLGFLINSGSVDSMVANYTANKKRRRKDSLAPGGVSGARPDRALIVYSNCCRQAYKDVSIVIGGLEASLRRLAHYDYWDNKVRRSILLDSKADILVYGMGEKSIVEIANSLNSGFDARDITWIDGTVVRVQGEAPENAVTLPSYSSLVEGNDKYEAYCNSFLVKYDNNEHIGSSALIEQYDDKLYIIQNPPVQPLTASELDKLYTLPYMYDQHPIYKNGKDEIPALHEIKFSIAHVRGCFGNCAFCAITYHQGRIATARTHKSVLEEAKMLSGMPDFKGYIHDIGGPTANFRGPACKKQLAMGSCKRRDCLFPGPCENLIADHSDYIALLKKVRELPKIKKVFIRSGIRYDYILADKKYGNEFVNQLVKHHVSGTLKVAPEHTEAKVLKHMRKPPISKFETFSKLFAVADAKEVAKQSKKGGKNRHPEYLIPYYISSHPGCTLKDAYSLSKYVKEHGDFVPDQIQDFYPTPGTLSTCMYYTGMDPFTKEKVYVPDRFENRGERELQRALLHYKKPENKKKIEKALRLMENDANNWE